MTNSRPVVMLIDSENESVAQQDNQECLALAFCLQNDLGCEVVQFENCYEAMDNFQRVKQYATWTAIAIVKQTAYMPTYLEFVQRLRTVLPPHIPIDVIPVYSGGYEEAFRSDGTGNLYAHHYGAELIELVKKAVSEYEPPQNVFGVYSPQDFGILIGQLEAVYQKHYLSSDDDRMFGTPDHNTMVVAEALRVKLLPAATLKEEFDDALPRKQITLGKVPNDIYRQDIRTIKRMNREEREQFKVTVLRAQGYEPSSGGGVLKVRTSFGEDVIGFAIHPETLQCQTTNGHGLHAYAKKLLAERIQALNEFRRKLRGEEPSEDDRYAHVVGGLILLKVDGFSTPLLTLETAWLNAVETKKVAHFIMGEQKYIPIDHNGCILRG